MASSPRFVPPGVSDVLDRDPLVGLGLSFGLSTGSATGGNPFVTAMVPRHRNRVFRADQSCIRDAGLCALGINARERHDIVAEEHCPAAAGSSTRPGVLEQLASPRRTHYWHPVVAEGAVDLLQIAEAAEETREPTVVRTRAIAVRGSHSIRFAIRARRRRSNRAGPSPPSLNSVRSCGIATPICAAWVSRALTS